MTTKARERTLTHPSAPSSSVTTFYRKKGPDIGGSQEHPGAGNSGTQYTESEGHQFNPRKGIYDSGGPFYTSRVEDFFEYSTVSGDASNGIGSYKHWTCGAAPALPTDTELNEISYGNIARKFGSRYESEMKADGTTAISQSAPTNPCVNLGTTLAESMREGIPTLPGIKTWRDRVAPLRGVSSEFLNYEFGWAPLLKEVTSVVDTVRHQGTLLEEHRNGAGRNTMRHFTFPGSHSTDQITGSGQGNIFPPVNLPGKGIYGGVRSVSLVRETKRWFVGCFTYAVPSSERSWGAVQRAANEANSLYGLALTPDLLWELTPWSWAVDWFSNAGDVINNVTQFAMAGLVMRYGFSMREDIEEVRVDISGAKAEKFDGWAPNGAPILKPASVSIGSSGTRSVTKRRSAASPFGFSIGWEGLSPTQLAITAALGITRLL